MLSPIVFACCRRWIGCVVAWLHVVIVPVALVTGAELASNVVVNPVGATYDSHPSVLLQSDGTTWVAWHAYRESRDQILLRRVDADGTLGAIQQISERGVAHSPPLLIELGQGGLTVIWSAQIDGHWSIQAREFQAGKVQPAKTLSPAGQDAIYPAAVKVAEQQLMVAWSGFQDGQFRIYGRRGKGKDWQDVNLLSSGTDDAFRPHLCAATSGDVWVFWDCYRKPRYAVMSRQLLPQKGPVKRLSAADRHGLSPTALATDHGLYVAWVDKQDVMGGPGVVSQMHTVRVARQTASGWQLIRDVTGQVAGAELTQGLMGQVEPVPVATGGYLGRRTAPMLVEQGKTVWLLWERKTDHRGRTPNVVGDLLGRPIRQGQWQKPVLLHQGRLDYHLAEGFAGEQNPLVVLASELPRKQRRVYHRELIDLKKSRPLVEEPWKGWKPVNLPVKSEMTARAELSVGKKRYRLYWADMHCHSALTADAEGEHDELMVYSRDRGRLDVVVFTNNDFIYEVPLTQYEYVLGNFFAAVFSDSPRFIALPGYEWTSRVPGLAGVPDSNAGNYTWPYQNKSYPNHRSVIYPPTGGPAVRYHEVHNSIDTLNEAVLKAGGITFTQHDRFRPSGHEVEVGMELTSGWRNYIARVPDLFHDPLKAGARLGFVANGDSHRRTPGLSGALTGIYASELTVEAIFDALRKRRCFATNGSRIFVDARADGTLMGQDAKVAGDAVNLTLHSIGTRPIVSAVLIRDGEEIKRFAGNGKREIKLSYRDDSLSSGTHWYYWRISQEQDAPVLPGNMMAAYGHLAWSTPNWVIVPNKKP